MSTKNTCPDCKGKKIYVPLFGPAEDCSTCGGTGESSYAYLQRTGQLREDVVEDDTMSDGDDDEFDNIDYIVIAGDRLEVLNVQYYGDQVHIETDMGDYVIFEDSDSAGQAAREYWEDMAQNDPSEFSCMVGESTLVSWSLGRPAGPGYSMVTSLSKWLDLWLDTPEEHFASFDGAEWDIDSLSGEWAEELGFTPTVAYRTN